MVRLGRNGHWASSLVPDNRRHGLAPMLLTSMSNPTPEAQA